jgi:hypothetical protein
MKKYIFLIILFIILYSLFVTKVTIAVENYSEIIVAAVFFFAFFSGFFIARQNERYSEILKIISSTDGAFSFLYRISGLIPRVKKEVREIIREHYQKIEKSNNWAYHILNPSVTITILTKQFSNVSSEESSAPAVSAAYTNIWGALQQLQDLRKKTIFLYHQKLLFFQWLIIYTLGFLLIFSLNLIPDKSFLINLLKIIFGTVVFIAIILLKQLDTLEIFGKDFAKKTAKDIFRILDEKDIEEIVHG